MLSFTCGPHHCLCESSEAETWYKTNGYPLHVDGRAPSQLEEAGKRLTGAQSDDDGRVEQGDTGHGPKARNGRFFSLITGFPFPLGPLLSRQTVRYEVCNLTVVS